MRKLNILYIHRTHGAGVEGVHIYGIVNAWRKKGHKVTILSPHGFDTEVMPQPKHESNSFIIKYAYQLISRFSPEIVFEIMELCYGVIAKKKLNKFLLHNKIDLIYERYSFFSRFGYDLSVRYQIPYVSEVNYTSKVPLVRKKTNVFLGYCQRVEKQIFGAPNTIISVISSYLLHQLVYEYGADKGKIVVLPNAADPKKFIPIKPEMQVKFKLGLPSGKLIGFVGGFYPWHGLGLLVEAFSKVVNDIDDCHLVLVGDGPERANIIALVNEKHLVEKVQFVGFVDHDRLPEYVANFDVAVMPDSNEYGSPMKIFEYMAAGKAIVAPDYGPLKDVINNNENGILFRKKDVGELSKALIRILNDNDFKEMLGGKARYSIERKHNWARNAELILTKTF